MLKRIVVLSMIVLGSAVSFSLAEESGMMNSYEADALVKENVGNKICPIEGGKIGEMGPAQQVEYNGKMYNLCCAMCMKDFNSDPAKYSKMAEDELAKTEMDDEGMNMDEGMMDMEGTDMQETSDTQATE